MDSEKSYLYKDEFDGIASGTSIRITNVNSRNDLNEEVDKFIVLYKDIYCRDEIDGRFNFYL